MPHPTPAADPRGRPTNEGAARQSDGASTEFLNLCLDLVALTSGITLEALRAKTRCSAEIARARQTAMYLANTTCGLSLSAIGRALGRDRTTVGHACRLIEDSRDDATIDERIASLDQAMRVAMEGKSRARQRAKPRSGNVRRGHAAKSGKANAHG